MAVDWQQIGVLVLAALAAGYVGRRVWRSLLGKGRCPACSACRDDKRNEAKPPRTIVPIESLEDAARAKSHNGGSS